jgi:protein-disulfide isomerase
MRRAFGLLALLVVLALLVAACGPQMATPTPDGDEVATAPTAGEDVEEAQPSGADPEPEAPQEMPVDDDDWHVLGSPEAEVTIVEYSDFQ